MDPNSTKVLQASLQECVVGFYDNHDLWWLCSLIFAYVPIANLAHMAHGKLGVRCTRHSAVNPPPDQYLCLLVSSYKNSLVHRIRPSETSARLKCLGCATHFDSTREILDFVQEVTKSCVIRS